MGRYTLIKNARVVKLNQRRLDDLDILIHHAEDGINRIARLEKSIDRRSLGTSTVSVVNARGNLVVPSFTDLATTLREPGAMYKEEIASTCRAAMAGGYHALLTYFEPDMRFTTQDVLAYQAVARKAPSVSLYPAAHAESGAWDTLSSWGAFALSDRFGAYENAGALYQALVRCKENDLTFFSFANTPSLTRDGTVNQSIAKMMKQKGISPVSEELSAMTLLLLAEEVGCRVHLSGLSTARALDAVRKAKSRGVSVSCDVSPYHFFLNESAILFHGNTAKMMPPLRDESDRAGVIEAIVDGTVDAIASHHTPNDKSETDRVLALAPFGAVSLESVFSAAVEGLLLQGYIDIFRLCELLCEAPHRILSQACGKEIPPLCAFCEGDRADFNLVSLDRRVTVEADSLKGRAKNTPFLGVTLQGSVEKSFFSKG